MPSVSDGWHFCFTPSTQRPSLGLGQKTGVGDSDVDEPGHLRGSVCKHNVHLALIAAPPDHPHRRRAADILHRSGIGISVGLLDLLRQCIADIFPLILGRKGSAVRDASKNNRLPLVLLCLFHPLLGHKKASICGSRADRWQNGTLPSARPPVGKPIPGRYGERWW